VNRTGRADVVPAVGLIGLGGVVLSGISQIGFGAGYDRIGPRFFPYVVAVGMLGLGAALLLQRWLGRQASPQYVGRVPRSGPAEDAAQPKLNARPLVYIGFGLLLFLILMERAGFVVASTLQFWLVARAFDSRRPVRDAVVAILLAISVYAVFSYGLGLTLPSG
jgi:putative tricarboxylic transport membrane protein